MKKIIKLLVFGKHIKGEDIINTIPTTHTIWPKETERFTFNDIMANVKKRLILSILVLGSLYCQAQKQVMVFKDTSMVIHDKLNIFYNDYRLSIYDSNENKFIINSILTPMGHVRLEKYYYDEFKNYISIDNKHIIIQLKNSENSIVIYENNIKQSHRR